jgi:hypothetical protein
MKLRKKIKLVGETCSWFDSRGRGEVLMILNMHIPVLSSQPVTACTESREQW